MKRRSFDREFGKGTAPHSRRRVGFATGLHHDEACVAIAIGGGTVAGVLFHTDQGGEYIGNPLVEARRSAGVTQSVGRIGSALAGQTACSRVHRRIRPPEGIPPTACSARSTSSGYAQRASKPDVEAHRGGRAA